MPNQACAILHERGARGNWGLVPHTRDKDAILACRIGPRTIGGRNGKAKARLHDLAERVCTLCVHAAAEHWVSAPEPTGEVPRLNFAQPVPGGRHGAAVQPILDRTRLRSGRHLQGPAGSGVPCSHADASSSSISVTGDTMPTHMARLNFTIGYFPTCQQPHIAKPPRADSEVLSALVGRGGEQIQPSVPLNKLEHSFRCFWPLVYASRGGGNQFVLFIVHGPLQGTECCARVVSFYQPIIGRSLARQDRAQLRSDAALAI